MSGFDGNGQFSFTYLWTNDAANGVPITASRMDTQFADATQGFDLCLTRDGQGSATADLPMNNHKFTGLANGTAATDSATFGQLQTAAGSLTGFLGGLALSAPGGTGTFGIALGSATNSTNSLLMGLPSAFTKTQAIFAAGTGNGGLDAGVVTTNTWYHVYLIGATVTTSDILFSLSATAPTLPGGYTAFRRIGSMKTDGSSNWIRFFQTGNDFYWDPMVQDNNSAVSLTGSLLPLTVPSGVMVKARMIIRMVWQSQLDQLLLIDPRQTSRTVSSANFINQISASTEVSSTMSLDVWTDTSRQVYAKSTTQDGIVVINTLGWFDPRGQA